MSHNVDDHAKLYLKSTTQDLTARRGTIRQAPS
jgi:hypothetical protein